MGFDFAVVDLYIENHDGYDSLCDLCRALKQQFPPSDSELRFNIEGGSINVSCPCDYPGYHIEEELEDLADFLGPSIIVSGTARLEDVEGTYYREIEGGKLVYAGSSWLEAFSAKNINRLQDISEWILGYTPEQVDQLKEYAEKTFGGKR